MSPDTAPLRVPASLTALFFAFNRLALRGFGGVLPHAQRVLVEEERWLHPAEFVELLALAQVLPGPNIVNLSLMLGQRFFGLRGALVAFCGMLAAPIMVVLCLAAVYEQIAGWPPAMTALRGMGAVSVGLIAATGFKMLGTQRRHRVGWFFVAATFVAVGLLRWPLVSVMGVLGLSSIALTWWRARP